MSDRLISGLGSESEEIRRASYQEVILGFADVAKPREDVGRPLICGGEVTMVELPRSESLHCEKLTVLLAAWRMHNRRLP